ncbi:efflux RND transporter periplasmic adaptor subunit [Metallibacterium sp.]|jgi:multidrug efflux system membrane fusion protein|uniref:efflux RND transporter periplasmic adaptor subunit n=1 Tax=Metallibacterium sp. TaxID=2940281 RepID=UPI00262D2CB0|nr:efflux RND transporter periplasmic adaptor subunit [Metallibacterium sp.]
MSRWKIVAITVVVLVVAIIGYRIVHRPTGFQRGKGQDAPIPVTVVPATRENVPVYLTALGTVSALNTVTVVPQVAGQLVSVNFKEGKEIKKGDVIAQIDPRTFQAAVEQAQGKLAQDQALLSAAKYLASSYENLGKKQYVAAQTLQAQEQTVRQYQAAVLADKAALDSARVQLGYTTIRAPINGVAGLRLVDVGNIVGPTTSGGIVVLTQIHPISVLFNLPQQNIEAVRDGMTKGALQVAALDRSNNTVIATGALKVINNQIDTSTSTFQLKAEFANPTDTLWPGQFVNVRLQLGTLHDALVVPAQAVQRGPDGDYVFAVQPDNTVKMQPVTTGGEAGASQTVISKGLSAGVRVVTEGQFRLKQNSKVIPLAPGQVPPMPKTVAAKARSGGGHRG